jgi:hypothetical protein
MQKIQCSRLGQRISDFPHEECGKYNCSPPICLPNSSFSIRPADPPVAARDADVLLFGAAEVYKNIFESNRFVERYRMSEIEHELGVTRDKCIKLAMLLGSGARA